MDAPDPVPNFFTRHILSPLGTRPVYVEEDPTTPNPFHSRPLLSPLLFANNASDARDHLANERTFLSWLRLSIYMAVVSIAIIVSFHLKSEPTALEKRMAFPVGLIFWALSFACLGSGVANYVNTVRKYAARRALVQTGWKTQVIFTVVSTSIVAACVLFLSTDAVSGSQL